MAVFDTSNVYCELFALDTTNGRYYIVEDPPWTPSCPHPWVTVPVAKFQALVDAYEAEDGGPDVTTGPFNLSVADGIVIGYSMLSAFAIAWAFKVLARAIQSYSSDDKE